MVPLSISKGMNIEEKSVECSLQLCRAGDPDELSRVYAECLPLTQTYLQNLGASREEAESFAAEILSDCLVGTLQRPPLINQYEGRSSLATWLISVARNRYFDCMRAPQKPPSMASSLQDMATCDEPTTMANYSDESLFHMLRSALSSAFQSLSATDAVILQLVHGHNVDQRLLARVLGWSDTKMSRHLASLRTSLKSQVYSSLCNWGLGESPRWQDWVEVCARMAEPF